jgi:hypothetical protein
VLLVLLLATSGAGPAWAPSRRVGLVMIQLLLVQMLPMLLLQ